MLSKDHMLSGQIHKKVQKYVRTELLKPNMKLIDLANGIESKIKELTNYDPKNPLKAGVAFPTGLNLNECAAHFSPNPEDTEQVLGPNDIIKIDFGVHINGFITDGAFSFSFNNRFDELIKISEEATATGMKLAGVDAYVGDIGKEVQEVIECNEIELDGKLWNVKSTRDLCGHQIGQYRIHCGKPVPNVFLPILHKNENYRMKEGEVYAIETFPTTGDGLVMERPEQCSHYMANYHNPSIFTSKSINQSEFAKSIDKRFSTLCFCKRYMNDDGLLDNVKLDSVVAKKLYTAYPPLYSQPVLYH